MIEKFIWACIRNRFLVLILAAGLAGFGIYAVLNAPVDAIPDLSKNQVIVFTDWMGGSPRAAEDEVTDPLSLKLHGLAGLLAGLLIADEVVDIFLPVRFYWVSRVRWSKLHGERGLLAT